jgi:4-hydroxy-2-oxoheptanedioate aldolase
LNATWRSRYGRDDLPGAMAKESEQTLVVAMIEDLDGLQNAAAIAAVPGIDVLLEGAADLSQSLGVPWQLRHADVQQRIADIASAAADAGKQFGALPRNPVDIATWKARGVTLFVLGDDRGITRRALSSHLQTYRSTGMAG